MALNKEILTKVAKRLLAAAQDQQPIDPLTDTFPDITTEEAYRIQLKTVEMRLSRGEKTVGKKIGLTSQAIQQMFNVAEPDYGHLLDGMLVYQGVGLVASKLLQPRIEGEIAFILERDLVGPGVTPTDVIRATSGVVAALEVIDSRVRDWKIKIQDTVADNASSAAFILGNKLVSTKGLDLRYVGYVMIKNGQLATVAAGAAVLGNPVQSVTWLANKMGEYGISLKAGEIILSGSAGPAVTVQRGDSIHLTVDRLGDVGCYFS